MNRTNMISLSMVLIGVILVTYATTRYYTTKYVLETAQDRMDAVLKSHGLYEHVYSHESSESPRIEFTIRHAGGMYYWWNNAIPYWAAGCALVASGLAVTRYKPIKRIADHPRVKPRQPK